MFHPSELPCKTFLRNWPVYLYFSTESAFQLVLRLNAINGLVGYQLQDAKNTFRGAKWGGDVCMLLVREVYQHVNDIYFDEMHGTNWGMCSLISHISIRFSRHCFLDFVDLELMGVRDTVGGLGYGIECGSRRDVHHGRWFD